MNPLARLTLWRDLVDETATLVRDVKASFVVDADHAIPSLPIRMAALRGQARAMCAHDCPASGAWAAASAFLPALAEFVALDVTPARQLALADDLLTLARVLGQALPEAPALRQRADIDG